MSQHVSEKIGVNERRKGKSSHEDAINPFGPCNHGLAHRQSGRPLYPTTLTLDVENSALEFTSQFVGHPEHECPLNPKHTDPAPEIHPEIRQSAGASPPAISARTMFGQLALESYTDVERSMTDVILQLGHSDGPFPANGTNPGTIDFGGLLVTFVSGILSVDGTPAIDFSTDPVSATLPYPSLAYFNETGGPLIYTVEMDIPIDISGVMMVDGEPMTYSLIGNLAYDGGKETPEPTSWILLAAGGDFIAVGARCRMARLCPTAAGEEH